MAINVRRPGLQDNVSALEKRAAAAKAAGIVSASELTMIPIAGNITGQGSMIAIFTPGSSYKLGAPLADLRVANAIVTPITADGRNRRWLVRFLSGGNQNWILISGVGGSLSWTTV